MQQHPIPQNVTQYEFRLVGDMTLKQFLELCIGLGLAYLFFSSNLIFIFKWPLIIISILFGAALAFFPLEDRPLDQWIINFLKAIYQPTRFIWEKTNKIPRLFLFEAHPREMTSAISKTIKAPSKATLDQPTSDLSELETTKISSIDSLFASIRASTPAPEDITKIETEVIEKPTISIRKLTPQENIATIKLPPPVVVKAKEPEQTIATPTASMTPAPITNLTTPKKITLPASPKIANLVTGVVVDEHDKLVENAIVQILSSDGIPARAMKTNSLGQFYTSTPLGVGTYVIEVDKEGLNYSPQKIIINDTILSPIELKSTT